MWPECLSTTTDRPDQEYGKRQTSVLDSHASILLAQLKTSEQNTAHLEYKVQILTKQLLTLIQQNLILAQSHITQLEADFWQHKTQQRNEEEEHHMREEIQKLQEALADLRNDTQHWTDHNMA